MIDIKLNEKLEKYIDEYLGNKVFLSFDDNYIKLDRSRGYDNIRITFLYHLSTGYFFETNANMMDSTQHHLLNLKVSKLMKSEANAIIIWLSKYEPTTITIARELTNIALLKINGSSIITDFKLNI